MHQFTIICVLFGLLNVIKCDWWENSLIYEIATKSFKDSDGDGIGDINGITSKLDYIVELGVDAIWLPGIYATPDDDIDETEYQIINHKKLNRVYGKLDEFKNLVTKAHEKSLKIFLDFVPGYTSKDHIWFLKSTQNETIYTDYYVWTNPIGFDKQNNPIPPRNPPGSYYLFGYGWVFNEMRKQFYSTKLGKNFPRLNLQNLVVVEEMKKILRFWLNIGVDGFFVQDASRLCLNSLFESQKVLREFRILLDEYKNKEGSTRLLIADGNEISPRSINQFYDQTNYSTTHFPFNHKHLMTHSSGFLKALDLKYNIDNLLHFRPDGKVAAWASESYTRPRIPIILGLEYISIAAVQSLLLPGVASIFYGQEIGLRGIEKYISDSPFVIMWFKQEFMLGLIDYKSASCPMQWDSTPNAGFTKSDNPWSDIRTDYWEFNVEDQKKKKGSYYNFYKELIKLRKTDTCKYGDVKTYEIAEYTFAFTRSVPEEEMYIAIFNLDYKNGNVELNTLTPKSVKSLTVLLASPNSYQKTGDTLSMNSSGKLVMEMRPMSVVVFTTASFSKL